MLLLTFFGRNIFVVDYRKITKKQKITLFSFSAYLIFKYANRMVPGGHFRIIICGNICGKKIDV